MRLRTALGLCGALMWGACRADDIVPPTEVVVVITADTEIALQADAVHVRVLAGAAGVNDRRKRFQESFDKDELEWPIHLVITPRGNDASREFEVVAVADVAAEPGAVEVRVVSGFVARQTRQITLTLSSACLAKACDDDETCDDGACRSVERNINRAPVVDGPVDLVPLVDVSPARSSVGDDGGPRGVPPDASMMETEDPASESCAARWDESSFDESCWAP